MGREVAVQARLCLRDIETLVAMVRQETGLLRGHLALGVIPTIAPFLLPRFMPPLQSAYPDLQLFLREDMTGPLVEALLDGELDVVLMALPYEMRHVDTRVLFRDPFRLACRQGTRRVDPEHYRFNLLQQESVLLLQEGHCLREHALAACRIRKLEKVSRFAASSLLTLVQMVDADLGITFLPAMAEGSVLLTDTRVRTYALDESAYRDIGLVWRQGSGREKDFATLGDLVTRCRPGAA
jgi:LysR family hydrogen peroxide-inducible transcriptional activator